MNPTPQSGKGFSGWYKRQSRIGRISFILAAAIVIMFLLGRIAHVAALLFLGPIILCLIVLSPLLIILLYRWTTQRLLWKVRNRLIVTYALMSLAPVILCLTLFFIASYVFAGQFATNSALTLLDQASAELRNESAGLALLSAAKTTPAHATATPPAPAPAHTHTATQSTAARGSAAALPLWVLTDNSSGVLHPIVESTPASAADPFVGQPIPSWLHSGFHGIVGYNGKLYLCAFLHIPQAGHTLSAFGAQPLDKATIDSTANGLGRVLIIPGFTGHHRNFDGNDSNGMQITDDDDSDNIVIATPKGKQTLDQTIEEAQRSETNREHFDRVDGGALPRSARLLDPPVVFSAPLTVTSWQTGDRVRSVVAVFSRPSVLYNRLFATTNGLGTVIGMVLIAIAIFFALLELFALLMAAGLSRTITRSVGELYRGTREIDRGNFDHRIIIKRKDQLGTLANSFNGMTASIVDLLAQQREKERLLSELSIAREVQANLFPHSPVTLPGFEIHAVCQPARTVSGDYFDFIFGRHGNDLCLALGDISGKGISAALLMASLHSAVRAFGISNSDNANPNGTSNPSPALLLELLNKHIFASTPPEKYATLFLAYYNAATRKLTYSNAGHLAPMILSRDGMVKHLDRGGTPVGLLNGHTYEEDTIELQSGDLLLAFSDGLTEPEQNDEQFGEDRLLSYVRQHCTEPLPKLAADTLHRLQDWIGNQEQPDDMTLLLARQL